MLSLKHGVPLVMINGGKHDKKIIRLVTDDDPIKLSADFKKKYQHMKLKDIRKLYKLLREKGEPPTTLKRIYDDAIEDMKGDFDKLILTTGSLQVLPRDDICEKMYVSGVSGSGKSYFVSKYLEEFKFDFPEDNIFIFSSVDEDECLDVLEPIRIPITESLVEEPLHISEFQDSIIVFDDCDTIKDVNIRKAVARVQAEVIEIGRHNNARCITTSHIISNYQKTRQILNEATSVVFFPKSGGKNHIVSFLKNNIGLSKYEIERVMNLDSRWVSIYKTYPSYIVWDKGISLLSEF